MIPNTKAVSAARRHKDRANEALRLDPFNPEHAAAVIAAHARLAAAVIDAVRQPAPAPKPKPDPAARHQANATRWQATANARRRHMDQAAKEAANANASANHVAARRDHYSTEEIVAAKARAIAADKHAKRTADAYARATHRTALARALAEGKPAPIPTPEEDTTRARRETRWTRTERTLVNKVTRWSAKLDKVTAELESPQRIAPAIQDQKATWQETCAEGLRNARLKLAAFRAARGIPADPDPDDDLERDENGNFIL
jgi:hypothetical protein